MLSDLGRDTQRKYKNKSYKIKSQTFQVYGFAVFCYCLGAEDVQLLGYSSLKNKVIWQVTSFSREVFVERAELSARRVTSRDHRIHRMRLLAIKLSVFKAWVQ